MVKGMAVIWGCTLNWWPFLPAGLITHWAYLNTVCLPPTHPLTASHTCVHTHALDKTLWSEGLQAHRVVIHSHCASPLVPHHSLSSHVLHYHDIHTRPCQSCLAVWRSSSNLMCQVHEGWGIQRKRLPFWFLKPLHFLFHSISPLLAQSFSSSLIITPRLSALFFFYSSLRPRLAWFLCFLQLLCIHSDTLVQSSTLLLSSPPLFQPTYEVVAHSQVVVPHRDLKGFLCQLVQSDFIWKLLCRWCTQEHIYSSDS